MPVPTYIPANLRPVLAAAPSAELVRAFIQIGARQRRPLADLVEIAAIAFGDRDYAVGFVGSVIGRQHYVDLDLRDLRDDPTCAVPAAECPTAALFSTYRAHGGDEEGGWTYLRGSVVRVYYGDEGEALARDDLRTGYGLHECCDYAVRSLPTDADREEALAEGSEWEPGYTRERLALDGKGGDYALGCPFYC